MGRDGCGLQAKGCHLTTPKQHVAMIELLNLISLVNCKFGDPEENDLSVFFWTNPQN